MRAFREYNPLSLLIFFLCAVLIPSAVMNPVIALLSAAGSVSLGVVLRGKAHGWLFLLALLAVMTLVNPLFSRSGVTVLFVVNDSPVTLEALICGAVVATSIVSALCWLRSFSAIMTADKLLYLFGSFSPRLSLVLSIALRYIPLLRRQARRINRAQTALGLCVDEGMRGKCRIFSVLTTWALENGIVTADSMTARGCGLGRRTFFSPFRFGRADALLSLLSVALAAITAAGLFICGGYDYYPEFSAPNGSPLLACAYVCYGVLAFLPSIIEAGDKIKWKYLHSKI